MKIITISLILVLTLMSLVSSMPFSENCLPIETYADKANDLKNLKMDVTILDLNGNLINKTTLKFAEGNYNGDIYSSIFCSDIKVYKGLNKGGYRTIIDLPEWVTVNGSLEHTFFRYPFDCELEKEYRIDNENMESVNSNLILTNNLNYSLPLFQLGLDSNEYNFFFTFIDGERLNFTKNINMPPEYSVQPHTAVKMTLVSLNPTSLNKDLGDYYGLNLTTTSSNLEPINLLCGRINKITQKVIIPKTTNIFNKLDVWEIPLHTTQIIDREDSIEYVWIKEGDIIEPTIVFYRYVVNTLSIGSAIFWVVIGLVLGEILYFFRKESKEVEKSSKEVEHKKIPTPKKPLVCL